MSKRWANGEQMSSVLIDSFDSSGGQCLYFAHHSRWSEIPEFQWRHDKTEVNTSAISLSAVILCLTFVTAFWSSILYKNWSSKNSWEKRVRRVSRGGDVGGWFLKTGSDVCYLSFADALQAGWLIWNAQITWRCIRCHKIRQMVRWFIICLMSDAISLLSLVHMICDESFLK